MARSTMSALITEMRSLIGDPAGASQNFTDDQIQTVLDGYKKRIRYDKLNYISTPGAVVLYKEYFYPRGAFESTVNLYNGSYTLISSALYTEDLLGGYWTFGSSITPPIFISGDRYDLYRAGADLTQRWAAQLKLQYNFTADGATHNLRQKYEALLELSKNMSYQAEDSVTTGTLYRADTC